MQAVESMAGLKAELKRWRASLPPSLQLDELSPTEIGFRSVIHLHQNYHHAWIMMCRIPLLVLVRERLKRTFTDQKREPVRDLRIESMA
jgi:RecB family exonuclease